MRRTFFNSTVLTLCYSLVVFTGNAQQTEQDRQTSSPVMIESFDWYATRDAPEPTIKYSYRRGLPEGESANFPSQNSSPAGKPEQFIYRLRIRNLSEREIISVAWRYEFFDPLTKELMARLEFESRARIRPRRRKTLYAVSVSPPTKTIDVRLLLLHKKQPYLESATIRTLVFGEASKKNRSSRRFSRLR